jgi:hypothetical protein
MRTDGVLRNIAYLDEDLILAELGNGNIFDHSSRFLTAPKISISVGTFHRCNDETYRFVLNQSFHSRRYLGGSHVDSRSCGIIRKIRIEPIRRGSMYI